VSDGAFSGADGVAPEPGVPPVDEGALFDSIGGWAGVLGRLAAGQNLTIDEARIALTDVLEGNATPAQIAAFVFGLRCKGETVEEMTGLVSAMLGASEPVVVASDLAARLVDTCGTGGDRSGTINVSTLAAIVVAAAGVPVCKHGGRAASSLAGSADLLEALGVVIDLGPAGVARCIEEAGMAFCFAPRYHPAMRHAIPVRRELGVPTAFNFLGPLANPARVRRQVVGVGDPAMASKMVHVLAAGGAEHVMVVYGAGGLDELSTLGTSTVHEFRRDGEPQFRVWELDPSSLGLPPASLEDLAGGDASVNAAFARSVLGGERGPRFDIVALNAAAGLVVGGRCPDLVSGLELARSTLSDGSAASCLERLATVSQEAGG
jgi:anthranilate phosphoribosyltransferase